MLLLNQLQVIVDRDTLTIPVELGSLISEITEEAKKLDGTPVERRILPNLMEIPSLGSRDIPKRIDGYTVDLTFGFEKEITPDGFVVATRELFAGASRAGKIVQIHTQTNHKTAAIHFYWLVKTEDAG